MLLPILHSVDGEPKSPGKFRLRASEFFPQRFDVEVIRHMHDETMGDFAARKRASFLGGFEEPRSNLRHDGCESYTALPYMPNRSSDRTVARCPQVPVSCTFALHGVLERLADEALIRNSRPGRGGSHRVEQLPWQAHVDSLAFGLKLEAERSHAGQVVFGQVGLFNKLLGFLIAFEAWQFLFHNASFPSCACVGR